MKQMMQMEDTTRRAFLGMTAAGLAAAGAALSGCGKEPFSGGRSWKDALPAASPDPESPFGVDANVNVATIDDYLGLEGVAYRDMRLFDDPADYESIGGNSKLSSSIDGFRVTPFPWVGTLAELPVQGAYSGERLFDIVWNGMEVVSATPRFTQSMQIIEELFPKDAPILLMCGGGGYAGMMRNLLIFLGWEANLLYNIGGEWEYTGKHPVIYIGRAGKEAEYYLWRADIVDMDFSLLKRLS